MASTTFIKGTTIASTWLNDINILTYTIFNGIQTTPSSGKILRSDGTNIVGSTFTIPSTFAQYDLIYASATNVLSSLAKQNLSVLVTDSSGVPSWSTSPTFAGLTLTGPILAAAGTAAAPSYSFSNATGSGMSISVNNNPVLSTGANPFLSADNNLGTRAQVSGLGWTGAALGSSAGSDLVLERDAANTLAQRNGVNAQTFRLYNTFTDVNNYERLGLTWAANVVTLATQAAGTGVVRTLQINSPTLVTPTLGVATATSINGNTFTTGTYTLTGIAAKTLTFNNTLTLSGTDATTMTFPSTSATIARTDAANTFTGTQTFSGGVNLGNESATIYRQNVAWTPQLQFGGANVGMTFSAQTGQYSRYGTIVIASFNLVLSAKGSSVGAATITGLPVNASTSGICTISYHATMATANVFENYINAGSSTITLGKGNALSQANLADTDFNSTTQITGLCIYQA